MTRWLAALVLAGVIVRADASAPRALDPFPALEKVSLAAAPPDLQLPSRCGVFDALVALEKVLSRQ